MRINKKKIIYLISPKIINKSFYKELSKILELGIVGLFQLRIKNENKKKKFLIGNKIQKICKKYKVKFIINDDVFLTKKLDADGCHLGQNDMSLLRAREILGKKIIGITCHNSIQLAKTAVKNKADYIAFGAFNFSKTKKIKYKANISLLKRSKR